MSAWLMMQMFTAPAHHSKLTCSKSLPRPGWPLPDIGCAVVRCPCQPGVIVAVVQSPTLIVRGGKQVTRRFAIPWQKVARSRISTDE